MRLAVGQAVALLFELVRDADESLLDTRDSESAYELIEQLATESDRHTARKERNHQRSCFKDVLNTLDVRGCGCVCIVYAFFSVGECISHIFLLYMCIFSMDFQHTRALYCTIK